MHSVSTYFSVSGTVTLDPQAWSVLSFRPTFEWLHEPDDGVTVTVQSDASVAVSFDRFVPQRNLGRYLEADLAVAAELGAVEGTVVVDCTDGFNGRSVTMFDADGTWHGLSECFHKDLRLHLSEVVPFPLPQFTEMMMLRPIVDTPVFRAVSAPETAEVCGCDGWDDDPVCAMSALSAA